MFYRIELNATRLASRNVAIAEVTGSQDTKPIQILQLEPRSYVVQTHAMSDTSWAVEVTSQGLIGLGRGKLEIAGVAKFAGLS